MIIGTTAAIIASGKREECKVTLANYNSNMATVAEARQYASCVYLIHGNGEPISRHDMLIMKGVVSSFVIVFVLGTIAYKVIHRKDAHDNGLIDALLLGGSLWAGYLLCIYLVLAWLYWLFW